MLNRLFGLRCPECGESIDENERYCLHCGTDLEAPIEQVVDKTKSKEYLEKAQTNYDKGTKLKIALHDCDLSIQYDPTSAEAHNLRGLILDAVGQTANAMASYQEALVLDPNFEDAKANLKDAESEFQTSSASKPGNQNNLVLKIILGVAGIFTILCGLLILGILYKFVLPYVGPKTQIIIEPDYSLISAVEPSDLETSAQILNERSRSLGYTGVACVASENNQIICQVPGSVDTQKFTQRIITIGLLEFVDFGDKSLPEGAFVATDFDYKYLSQPEGTQWHSVMTNREIGFASVTKSESGKYSISFTLSPIGSKIFLDFTTQNVNKFLGIVLDKHVISMPRINAPITNGSAMITGNFSQEQAENLATYLKIKGPLPIPLKVKQTLNSGN